MFLGIAGRATVSLLDGEIPVTSDRFYEGF